MNLIFSIIDTFLLLEFPVLFPFLDVLDSYLCCHFGFFCCLIITHTHKITINEPAHKYYAVRLVTPVVLRKPNEMMTLSKVKINTVDFKGLFVPRLLKRCGE